MQLNVFSTMWLFSSLDDKEASLGNMFMEKLNDMHEQGLDEVTLDMAESVFVDLQQHMLTKDTKPVAPKHSLWSQTTNRSLSNNSKYQNLFLCFLYILNYCVLFVSTCVESAEE